MIKRFEATLMSFYKKYELARMIRESEVKTFSGYEITTRRPIYLHLFENAASRPTLARLMQMVRQAEAAGQILEAGEFGGGSYVVTDPIDKFTTLRDYLEANPPAPGKLKSAAAPVSAPPQPQPAPDAAETPTKPSFRWPMPPQPAAVRFTPVPAAEPSDASSPIFETWPGTGAAPAPTPPPPAAFAPPSPLEVTQIFGLDNPPGAPPAPRVPLAGPGEMHSWPTGGSSSPPPPPPLPFDSAAVAPPPPPPPPGTAAPASNTLLILIVVGAGVLMIAALLVYWFLLRK